MIRFSKYKKEYYQQVCDFLIRINEENKLHSNWIWARFEWMHEHPLTKKELLDYMGLWFDDDELVGAALIDMFFGEAFVGALKAYQSLYPEILRYAFDNLKDDQGLGITINDLDKEEIEEALRQGFFKTEAEETVLRIGLKEAFAIDLPKGFTAETFDAENNEEEMSWLFWQGFDHGEDKEEFLKDFKEASSKRPHFNKYLCIMIRDENGEAVATSSTWYDERTDYAYVEPVCVIPRCRKKGLGKAAVYLSLNHAKELGAKNAIVVSNQDFYKRLGFKEGEHYSFYWKKEERVVNGVTYKLERLLGKGKGGYSYLAKANGKEYVLKQIHHEPCDYYKFGNKIEAEKADYQKLRDACIRIPKMIDIDLEREIVIKEYIEGEVISNMIEEGKSVDEYIPQLQEMATLAKAKGLNIDYYPTNFVVRNGLLYYIDYECNEYMDEWNLENWGMKYWQGKST